jgi:hypothetical protein
MLRLVVAAETTPGRTPAGLAEVRFLDDLCNGNSTAPTRRSIPRTSASRGSEHPY